jgi:hypothetical protein
VIRERIEQPDNYLLAELHFKTAGADTDQTQRFAHFRRFREAIVQQSFRLFNICYL